MVYWCLEERAWLVGPRTQKPTTLSSGESEFYSATRLLPGQCKHVELKRFALQQWERQGRLNLDKVTTTEQLADIMTKPCSFQTLSNLAPKIGLTKCVTDR